MTVTGLDNPAKPDHPDPEHLAVIGVAGWLREDRAAAEEYEEAMRADTHRHEMQRRMEATDRAQDDARVRVSGLIDKLNLDGRRMLAFWLGGAIVLALVMLDRPYMIFYCVIFGADLGFCRLVGSRGDLRSWLRWLRCVEAERDWLAEQVEYAALFRGRY